MSGKDCTGIRYCTFELSQLQSTAYLPQSRQCYGISMENRNPATLPEFSGRLSKQIARGVGAALRGTCQMAGMRWGVYAP